MQKKEKVDASEKEMCQSISEDKNFWNELHIMVEDGITISREEEEADH